MNSVCLIRKNINKYPKKETLFRPSTDYPEYLFHGDICSQENIVYDMIREGFISLELDKDNIGSPDWNPLGGFIKPGDNVLIKPNLVLHENRSGCGIDCVYTNPSLVAAVIDYVGIALKGRGKIVIGDAPLQECVFETLIKQSGYDVLCGYYKKKGMNIELADFRNVKTYEKDGLHYQQEEEGKNGCIVNLGRQSAFSDIGEERMRKLRITNYDPRILQQHHSAAIHEYMVSRHVLDADVIINMPKPKTHRKAGVTIALKNIVGINANKEFLPHHTLGSRKEGGDAYLHGNVLLKLANEILDIKNQLVHDQEMVLAKMAEEFYTAMYEKGKKQSGEEYWEGSWYGNDTMWRTIMDLNRIVFYADKSGNMTNERQRKMFIVGDMIVSGEKEGPLWPTPTYPGTIVMGKDPLQFDRTVCSLMGFDYRDIPTLWNDALPDAGNAATGMGLLKIISNDENWNGKSLDEIRRRHSLEFQPSAGWTEKLGNPYRDKMYEKLLAQDRPVCIFGAGINGVYAMGELQRHGIKTAVFCDNNPELWGREPVPGIPCIGLDSADMSMSFVVALREKNALLVTKQIEENGGTVFGVINR